MIGKSFDAVCSFSLSADAVSYRKRGRLRNPAHSPSDFEIFRRVSGFAAIGKPSGIAYQIVLNVLYVAVPLAAQKSRKCCIDSGVRDKVNRKTAAAVRPATNSSAAARLLRAYLAVTKDDRAVLKRDERHVVAVPHSVMLYH